MKKKMTLKEGETLVIKSDSGKIFEYDGETLSVTEPVKDATVLKSFRTEVGAKDYLERLSAIQPEKFEGAKVVTTLKGYNAQGDEDAKAHIIVENTVVTKSVVSDLIEHGLVDNVDGTLSFTTKWVGVLDERVNAEDEEFFTNLTALYKSVESSIPTPVENTDIGEPDPEKEAISDEEVAAAVVSETAPEVSSDMPGEALNPGAVRVTFKSWGDVKAWNNPDPTKYFVDSVGYAEQIRLGADAMYVVRSFDEAEAPLGYSPERQIT